MASVESAVIRLEPHIADVNLAMRPLRRVRGRLPSRPHAGEPHAGESQAGEPPIGEDETAVG
jgi:hypothetical protein